MDLEPWPFIPVTAIFPLIVPAVSKRVFWEATSCENTSGNDRKSYVTGEYSSAVGIFHSEIAQKASKLLILLVAREGIEPRAYLADFRDIFEKT